MWNILYRLASPKLFYQYSGKYLPWISIAAFICLSIGWTWGLFFAPPDYQQGDSFRIIYVHVPGAFLSMAIYGWMGFLSLLLLIWRIKLAGILLSRCAQVGASMACLALVTGSLWGKPMWGAWWVWDARLTSELILFFMYIAIIATKYAYRYQEQSDKMIAILTLVGLVDLPIIHYSVYWWNTLHQGATFSLFAKPKIHASMLYPLIFTLAGMGLFCLWIILSTARHTLLYRERRQAWVKRLVLEGAI